MEPSAAALLATTGALGLGPSPALFAALALYGLASLLAVSAFIPSPRWMSRLAIGVLVAAFVVHGIDIGWRGVHGVHPGMGVREALGFLSWLMVGGYLFWSLKIRLAVLGAFVAPGALIILAAARLTPQDGTLEGLTALGRVHISLATLGVAIFTLASGVAAVYLVQERSLKSKNFDGVLYNNSSALETLDRLAHRLVLAGFPIFTAAIVLGVLWVSQRDIELARVEHLVALIAWTVFATLVVVRTTRGWRGRRTAILTVAGFACVALVLAIYFLRGAL